MKFTNNNHIVLKIRLSSARFVIKNLERAIRYCLSHKYNEIANMLLRRLDMAFIHFERLYNQQGSR